MTDEEKRDSLILFNFILEREARLEGPETRYATDLTEHPQIDHVRFIPENNRYEMWDREGTYFSFEALPYDPNKEEELEGELKKLYKRRF